MFVSRRLESALIYSKTDFYTGISSDSLVGDFTIRDRIITKFVLSLKSNNELPLIYWMEKKFHSTVSLHPATSSISGSYLTGAHLEKEWPQTLIF